MHKLYDLDATTRRPNYNLKLNLYFKKRPLRSVNVFAHDPLAETYTLMHNIEARPPATVAQLAEQRFCKSQVVGSNPTGGPSRCRTQPNYNLKFNLYYKNRPLRSVNDFTRRPSTARPAQSTVQLLKLTDISQILKSIVPGPLVAYYTNMT